MKLKPFWLAVTALALCLITPAVATIFSRPSYQAAFEKSDVVVIGRPAFETMDTKERTSFPEMDVPAVGVETRFDISTVIKGDPTIKRIILHHYRIGDLNGVVVMGGPAVITFRGDERTDFLLFLNKEADGRYAPAFGQSFPAFQSIYVISPSGYGPPH